MMGTKSLRELREELRQRLAETGEDPIAWLEKRIAAGKRRGVGTDVLESLKRVLERSPSKKPRKPAGGAKTRSKKKDAIA
jgi:hypothetical protein